MINPCSHNYKQQCHSSIYWNIGWIHWSGWQVLDGPSGPRPGRAGGPWPWQAQTGPAVSTKWFHDLSLWKKFSSPAAEQNFGMCLQTLSFYMWWKNMWSMTSPKHVYYVSQCCLQPQNRCWQNVMLGSMICWIHWTKNIKFYIQSFHALKIPSLEKCRSGSLFWLGVVSPKQRRICLHPRDSLLVKESLGRKQVLGSFGKRLHFWSVVLNGVIDTLHYYYQSFMKHGAGGLEMVALRAAISIWQLSTHGWPNH